MSILTPVRCDTCVMAFSMSLALPASSPNFSMILSTEATALETSAPVTLENFKNKRVMSSSSWPVKFMRVLISPTALPASSAETGMDPNTFSYTCCKSSRSTAIVPTFLTIISMPLSTSSKAEMDALPSFISGPVTCSLSFSPTSWHLLAISPRFFVTFPPASSMSSMAAAASSADPARSSSSPAASDPIPDSAASVLAASVSSPAKVCSVREISACSSANCSVVVPPSWPSVSMAFSAVAFNTSSFSLFCAIASPRSCDFDVSSETLLLSNFKALLTDFKALFVLAKLWSADFNAEVRADVLPAMSIVIPTILPLMFQPPAVSYFLIYP